MCSRFTTSTNFQACILRAYSLFFRLCLAQAYFTTRIQLQQIALKANLRGPSVAFLAFHIFAQLISGLSSHGQSTAPLLQSTSDDFLFYVAIEKPLFYAAT